jgi:hypothetical protein
VADKTLIFNLALSMIGVGARVSLPSEESNEARECNLWFDTARDWVLRAAPWTSTRANSRLALQAERVDPDEWAITDPDPGWQFSYATPSDMLAPRYMSDYSQFILTTYGNQQRIVTNTENAILVYSKRQERIELWDAQLQLAVAATLGAFVCLKLRGTPATARMMEDRANGLILSARVLDANVGDEQLDTIPDWLAARGVAAVGVARYIYPFGPLVSVGTMVSVN